MYVQMVGDLYTYYKFMHVQAVDGGLYIHY